MMRNPGQKLDMHVRHSQKGWLPNSCAHAWLPCWIGVHEHKLRSRDSDEICLLSVLMNPQNRLSVIGPHSITRQSGNCCWIMSSWHRLLRSSRKIPLSDLAVVCEQINADTTWNNCVFKTGLSDTLLEHKRIRWRASQCHQQYPHVLLGSDAVWMKGSFW